MAVTAAGCDGWVSSNLHADSEMATSPQQLQQVYKQWAASYEQEMLDNDLQSYRSVTSMALALLEEATAADLVVMDAGCGTGLLGQCFKQAYTKGKVHLTGADLSAEMLEVASQKQCFDDLRVVNLKEPTTFEGGTFDLIISSGVFYPGHCGPEVLPSLVSLLKDDGAALITVRKSFYDELQVDFQKYLDLSGWRLHALQLMPYYQEIEAYVMVLRKE